MPPSETATAGARDETDVMLSGVKRFLKAVVQLGSHWPMSLGGTVFVVLGGVSVWFGRGRMDLVLSLAGIWILAIAAISGLAAGWSWLGLRRTLERSSRREGATRLGGVEGYRVVTGLSIPRRWIPLAASPEWTWLQPAAVAWLVPDGKSWREEVIPQERCETETIVRRVTASDLFGIWRLRLRAVEPRLVLLQPDIGRLDAQAVSSAMSNGELLPHPHARPVGELYDNRPYTRSDPARMVLWKVYARSRQLLVRAPETAQQPEPRPLVFLVAGDHDDAAAGAARALLEQGLIGRSIPFACDGTPVPIVEPEAIRAAIVRSRAHRDRCGADLAAALSDRRLARDAPVLLIAPARDPCWLAGTLPRIAARPSRFVVLAVADLVAAPPRRSGWRAPIERWFLRAPIAAFGFEQMLTPLQALRGVGCRIVLADRTAGRWLAPDAPR